MSGETVLVGGTALAMMQNTPVEPPEIGGPIQNTGEGPETPPGEALVPLAADSGVRVGDGTGADEDVPF